MITIENKYECFVALWRKLERTRQLFGMQYRRFCIRRVMHSWLGNEATDEMIWKVCELAASHEYEPVYGLDELPAPSLHPRRCREFLRALVAVRLGIGIRKVNLKALDRAYSVAFPNSTPLNVNKKRRQTPNRQSKDDDDDEPP
ncbi:MAG: hypothetical protein K5918_05045 [Bacteroidales bacterium]|nr:hypothetical protein [Bacteroidales bacterium]